MVYPGVREIYPEGEHRERVNRLRLGVLVERPEQPITYPVNL